jgi:phosphoenolpyruvate carboxylase
MNHKTLLSFTAFLFLVGMPAALLGQKENPGPELTLRQQVNTELLNLQRNIQLAAELPEKLTTLEKTLHVMKEMRKQNPVQLADDEIYLQKITADLEQIPKISEFEMDDCNTYRKQLSRRSHQKAIRKTEALALNQTLPVLDALCTTRVLLIGSD